MGLYFLFGGLNMVAQKKNYTPMSFRLEQSLVVLLNAYSKETGIPKTVIVEKALAVYLKKNSSDCKQPAEN